MKSGLKIRLYMEKYQYLAAFGLIGLLVFCLYWDYICGNILYIFQDCGADSFCQTYPNLLFEADRFRSLSWRAMFDFSIGLGDEAVPFLPGLDNWIVMFGREHIAYLLGISQCLKVILAGIFAYIFARLYGLKHMTCFLTALGYAFQAECMIRSAWESYPNNALLLIIWLTAFEYAYVKKNIIFLPLATVLYFYLMETYHCVFWGVILAVYIAFRMMSEEILTKKMLYRLCRLEAVYAVFAFLGMADTLSSKLFSTLTSNRLVENINILDTAGLFATEQELVCALLRSMGMAINGIGEDYKGYADFLMDPAYYCGILMILLVPVSLYNMALRKRRFYIAAYLLFGIYTLVEPIRMIINGFAGKAYKYNALWVIILLFLTAMHGLRVLLDAQEEIRRNSVKVFNLTIAVVFSGMLYAWYRGYVIRLDNWLVSIWFILMYTVLMNYHMGKKISVRCVVQLLCVCMSAEVLAVSWDCVNDRAVIKDEQVSEKGTLYDYDNDYQAAVHYLKEVDPGWYRLEKRTGICFLCDALAQDYNGTAAYIGGMGVGMDASGLYSRLGLPHLFDQWIYGSANDVYADSVFGVKYYLIETGKALDEYGFTYMATVAGVDIYKNELAMPLAYLSTNAMEEEEFLDYAESDRRKLLLENCILESEFVRQNKKPKEQPENLDNTELVRIRAKKLDGRYVLDQIPEGSVLIVRTDSDSSSLAQICYEDNEQNVHSRYFHADSENETVFYTDDIAAVWFMGKEDQWLDITDEVQVEFFYADADTYFESVRKHTAEAQDKALQMEEWGTNRIKGQIDCTTDGVLVTSIPYSGNWNILVDGKEEETLKVNTGFIGTKLEAGKHTVEFLYETNRWRYDNKFKCIGFLSSLLFTVAVFLRGKRKNDKSINRGSCL